MQRLIYGGRQLEDACTLSESKVEHDNELHLVLRVRGGLASIKFNSLSQEKTGHVGDSAETELNKHTFVTPGINFVARCENKACRI